MSDQLETLVLLSPINLRWYDGIAQKDHEARQKRFDLVMNSTALLDTMAEIIRRDLANLDKTPIESYDDPNWAYKEADRQGQRRALKNILALTQRTTH